MDSRWTYDLRNRTPVDSPDDRQETTDQKGAELQGGAAAPDPRVWLRSPRFFTPYRPTRTRQDLPCTSAGNPHPEFGSIQA